MKMQISKCDICGDRANILVEFDGSLDIFINMLDGQGDYRWHIDSDKTIDLCQKHKEYVGKFLTRIIGSATPEIEVK